MIYQRCDVVVDLDRRELRPHGTPDFPCAGFRLRCTQEGENVVPWHWHDDLEMMYADEGGMKVQVPGKTFHLRRGELVFINSNVLHYAIGEPRCEFRSLAFHASLVAGQEGSAFARRYLGPLTLCGALDGCVAAPGEPWAREAAAGFLAAFAAAEDGGFGYEFTVREQLSRVCLAICGAHRQEIETSRPAPNQDAARIRAMLDFIHDHYAEDIGLPDIARAADIGERECLRCFRREIQTSPTQYLIKYRVTQGAGLLRREPGSSIAEISARCGFDSPSNFAQMFKRFFKSTPREYRRQEGAA